MSSSIKSRKPSKPVAKMPNRKTSGGFPINFEGVHANPRIIHTLLSVMGKSCEAQVRNGSKYLGVFHSFNEKLDVNLSVAHLSKGQDEVPKTGDLLDDLVIPADKIVAIKIPNVDLSFAETDSVQANGDVPLPRNNSQGKDLQPWNGGDAGEDIDLDDDLSRTSNGWHPDEMFHTNTRKFGVKTTYDESLEQYTVKMDIANHDENKIKWANQMANDIESSDGYRHRINLELDDATTEEDKFSAVVRQPRDQAKPEPKSVSNNIERRDSRGHDNIERRDSRGHDNIDRRDMRGGNRDRDMKDRDRFSKQNDRRDREPWSKPPRYTNGGRSPQGPTAARSHGPLSPTDSPTNAQKHKPTTEKPPRFANKNMNQSHSRTIYDERHSTPDNMMRKNDRMPRRPPSGQSGRGNAWGGHGNANSPQDYHQHHNAVPPQHTGNKMPSSNYKNMVPPHGPNQPIPAQVSPVPQNQPKGKERGNYPIPNTNRPITSPLPVSTKSHPSPVVAQTNYPPGAPGKGSWSEIVSTTKQQQHMQIHQMHPNNAISPEHIRQPHIMNSEELYSYQVVHKETYHHPQQQQQPYANMPQRIPVQPQIPMQSAPQQPPNRNIQVQQPQPTQNTYPVTQAQPPASKPQQPIAQTQVSAQISGSKQPKPVPKQEPATKQTKPEGSTPPMKKTDETSKDPIHELKLFSQNFKLESGDKSEAKPSNETSGTAAKSPPRAKDLPKQQKTENVQRIPVATDNSNIRTNDESANIQPSHPAQSLTQQNESAQSPISEPQKPTTLPTQAPTTQQQQQELQAIDGSIKQIELNPDAKEFKPIARSEPATPVQGPTTPQPTFPIQHAAAAPYVTKPQYIQNPNRIVAAPGIPSNLQPMVYDQSQQMGNYQGPIQQASYPPNVYMMPHNSPSHHVPQNMIQQPITQMAPNYPAQFDQNNTGYVNRPPSHSQMMQQQRVTPHSMAHHYQSDQLPPNMPVYVPSVPSSQQAIPGQFPPAQPITVARPNSANSATVTASSPAQPQVPQVQTMYYPPNGQQQQFMMHPPMMPMHYAAQHQRQYPS